MSAIRFGTDGVRGEAGVGPLSAEAVLRLGAAVGAQLGEGARVLIGRDSRPSGPALSAALAAGLMAAGADVADAGLLPTAAVACAVARGGFSAGAVISASHNPPADNGVKLLGADGCKLPTASLRALEQALASGAPPAPRFGETIALRDPAAPYLDALGDAFADAGLVGMRVLVDCARGAGCATGPALLRRLGVEVIAVNDAPDGARINVGCGALAPESNAATVREAGAELAICLDGDADRAILLDADGNRVDGDAVMLMCARERHRRGALAGGLVVGTLMSNLGLERALAADGMTLLRAAVGDAHVAAMMDERGAVIGGEESGHLLFRDGDFPWGDGLHTALQAMRVMRASGQSLAELAVLRRFPQARRNLQVREKPPLESIDGLRELEAEVAAGGLRTLVRYSGTEKLARVLVEGETVEPCEAAADALAARISAAIGA